MKHTPNIDKLPHPEWEYPRKTIFTKIKFKRSAKNSKLMVGFVHYDTNSKFIKGVRENDPCPKMSCICSAEMSETIMPGVLYNVALIKDEKRNGYKVIDAAPCKFHATIETYYVPRLCYMVKVIYGNSEVIFDPKDGTSRSQRSFDAVKSFLERDLNIKNQKKVILDFVDAADSIIKLMKKDGIFVNASA